MLGWDVGIPKADKYTNIIINVYIIKYIIKYINHILIRYPYCLGSRNHEIECKNMNVGVSLKTKNRLCVCVFLNQETYFGPNFWSNLCM